MTAPTESDLTRARGGDVAALGALFRGFQAPLLRYLRARRTRAADDVASQVWIDVAGSIERFSGDLVDFRRWLFTIAHRRSVDEIRRSVRRAEIPDAHAGEEVRARAADADYECATALDRAIAMVGQLPDAMAEAVMLRVVNDLPISDVAAVMGRSEGSVRVLVHRGLRRLESRLRVTDPAPQTMEPTT